MGNTVLLHYMLSDYLLNNPLWTFLSAIFPVQIKQTDECFSYVSVFCPTSTVYCAHSCRYLVLSIINLTVSLIRLLWYKKDYFFLNLCDIQCRCPHNAVDQLSVNITISTQTMLCSILWHPLLLAMHSVIYKTLQFTCWQHSGSIQGREFLD
jgi:hypothetical protein